MTSPRLILAVAAMLGVALTIGAQQAPPADLILHNARVYTVDGRNPLAEAVAVRGDRIARVGSNAQVLALRGPATRMLDARGAAVVPGLQDAHGHFTELGAALQSLDLRGTTSYQQIVDRVRARASSARPGEWILGNSWDQNDWADTAWPTHDLLSAAAPANPVMLSRVDGHAVVANRRAIEIAGISATTKDPEGGRIVRTSSGQPTGVLIDRAQDLVASRVPPATASQIESRALLADGEMRRLGLTMVHDAGTDGQTVNAYRRLIDGGRLKTRLHVMLAGPLATLMPFFQKGPVTDDGNHRLAVRAIKIVADGALGSRGAALLEPYSDERGSTGLLVTPEDQIYAQTLAASRAGFQSAIHAIGDRANRMVLDVLARVQREIPAAKALRLRIEHAQILDAAEIPRFAALGVIASMQPTHATSDMPWVPARIGPARASEGAYVWRTLLAAGATIAAGSDFPVEQPNPMLGFYAAVTRQDPSGNPPGGWMPDERLTREEALKAFTLNAAYAAHAETWLGSLEEGKLADLVVLSHDIMTIAPKEILSTRARLTMIGGEIVYAEDGFDATR